MSSATTTQSACTARRQPPAPSRRKVAYLMSRFPKLTETFILYEMLAVEKHGVEVELYPLQRERTRVMHPEAVPLLERAHFRPWLGWRFVRSHLHFLRRSPGEYLKTLGTLLRANWGSLRYFAGAVCFFPKLVDFAYEMAGDKVDHVHAHFASHPAAAAWAIHRLTGIPYSFAAHGSDLHRDRHMLPEKVAEAAFVVAVSEYNRRWILDVCGPQHANKVTVVHCGVDTSTFPVRPPAERSTAARPFKVVCIGTLHEVKGQTYLVEACRQLHARGVDVVCEFAGDGPDEKMLAHQAAEVGLFGRVRFHGRLNRGEIMNLLADADVLATPSVPARDGRREGIPVVLMEAMASGVPVVATAISGIPELVEDGVSGLLVPPRDPVALADALERLAKDAPLRRRLAAAGRQKIAAEFDLDKNAAALVGRFCPGSRICC